MRVSVRELKDHLSKYLHLAQHGESVVVTSHNKPLAYIHPVSPVPANFPEIPGVRWALNKPNFSEPVESLPKISGTTLAETVLEQRK